MCDVTAGVEEQGAGMIELRSLQLFGDDIKKRRSTRAEDHLIAPEKILGGTALDKLNESVEKFSHKSQGFNRGRAPQQSLESFDASERDARRRFDPPRQIVRQALRPPS
jgi:hypothetical protein